MERWGQSTYMSLIAAAFTDSMLQRAAAQIGCMTLRIDASRALTTHEELAALVRAIMAAQVKDELDWIEWKIAGDLNKGPTQGTIARHILGLANRLPERAALHAGGWGYLIMGRSRAACPA
jgi:hypothetical protein